MGGYFFIPQTLKIDRTKLRKVIFYFVRQGRRDLFEKLLVINMEVIIKRTKRIIRMPTNLCTIG